MITSHKFLNILKKKKINFFAGVPDSVLKNLNYLIKKDFKKNLFVCANEGQAVSLAIGHYLSTKTIPCVYLQNSGLGNAINPLISIADKNVYKIPMLMIIGWRGSPFKKDEPQHYKQGIETKAFLKNLGIKYLVVKNDSDLLKVPKIIDDIKKSKNIKALLIPNNFLTKVKEKKFLNKNKVERYIFLKKLINLTDKNYALFSTTGYTSREHYEITKNEKNLAKNFFITGGMGHSSSIALGYALSTKKKVICLDGDGSVLMHLGALHLIGLKNKNNFKHIMFNNFVHESVGKQNTFSEKIDFKNLVYSLGYKDYQLIKHDTNLIKQIKVFLNKKGPAFLEVLIKVRDDQNLSRPDNFKKILEKFLDE